jgi:glycosyltransferase involved in cell wall biosynthesis
MRVLHVDSARGWRGGQAQVLLSARGMGERGHDVLLACQQDGVLERRARAAGLEVQPLRFSGDLSPRAWRGLRRAASRFRPDVLLLHDPHTLLPALAAAPRVRRVAVRRVDFPLAGRLSLVKYRRCARVIAVSRRIADVLRAGGLEPERVCVVYEGVPDRAPQPGGREALAALGVPRQALVVGNVAALTDHKDHFTLLAAAAAVREQRDDVWFVILGEGELRPALEARAAQLGLRARCLFLGFRDDLDRLIPAFDVFCLSSHMEGLGTSLLDAMCFARPVVATSAGGIPEAVVDQTSGALVPPRDAAALARALQELLSRPEQRAAWGAAGRTLFEQRFTDAQMVEQTLRALEQTV